MYGHQLNGDESTRPDSRSDGQAEVPTNSDGLSREIRENAEQESAKFNKSELDQLVQNMKLSDEPTVIRMKNLKGLKKIRYDMSLDVHTYANSKAQFKQFYRVVGRTKRLHDVAGLLKWMNLDYSNPSEWGLYIVHLHAQKGLDCFLMDPSGRHAVDFLVCHEVDDPLPILKQALKESGYEEHRWLIVGEFSAVSVGRRSPLFKLNQQGRRPNLIRFELQFSQAPRQTQLD